jgi:acyl-CoA thioesterase
MVAPEDDAILQKIRSDPFSNTLGMTFEEIRPGYARVSMTVKPEMCNFHGSAQGGALFSLADAAFGAAVNAYGQTAVALTVTIHFLMPAMAGMQLFAEAEELRQGRRAGFYQLTIRTGAGEPVAICQAVAHRRQDRLVK